MMVRVLFALLLVLPGALASAAETRLGLYLQGSRIGQALYATRTEELEGKKVVRGDSVTTITTSMLGSNMTIEMRSTSWAEPSGRPIRMSFVTSSGGRTQTVEARFGPTHADVTVKTGGSVSTKRIEIPKDAPIAEDPLPMVLAGGPAAKRTFYVFRSDTASFVKNEVALRGPQVAQVGERRVPATLVEVIDPMATLRVFVDAKGDLIKAEGPLGLEMLPEGAAPTPPSGGKPDLATASSIRPDKPLPNPGKLRRLVIRLENARVGSVPSDEHQTSRRDGDAWVIDVNPPRVGDSRGVTVAEAAAMKGEWLKPDTYIPSDDAGFRSLARDIIGEEKRVRDASLKVQSWIAKRMKVNAGIGVLRDASEILQTSEGVCRDAAILAATILRAGGIPTRLASGLVSWDGTFYYHAWVEVWDGKRWIGIDPTTTDPQISAAHIKLSGGNLADAFRFPLLDKVSIKVVRGEGS